MSERTIIVGDVHGCALELDELLDACAFSEGDALVSVGDLVAKGPDTKAVVQRVQDLGGRAVRGNHEQHCLKWYFANEKGLPIPELRPEHQAACDVLGKKEWRWLAAQPLWLELPEFGAWVVHAGVFPGVALRDQEPFDLMNIRSIGEDGTASKRYEEGRPWTEFWSGPQLIVFGHDSVRGLQQHPHAIGLDTGCVYGGHLTALILPSRQIVSVPARQTWVAVGG